MQSKQNNFRAKYGNQDNIRENPIRQATLERS